MNPNYPQGGAIPLPNPSYPMARLNGSAYAAPLNYNQPSEVVGGYDAKINPMTGEEIPDVNFAQGGQVGLASLLASRGRGGDSMLVHMNPEEVKGLQALALAHGGSLTVNPDTGLVEALKLKDILPQIAGAVLGQGFGFSPLKAAATVGIGYGLVEGDLKKGLMAGLGAYSGASIAGGLKEAAGASEEAKVGTTSTTGSAAPGQVTESASGAFTPISPDIQDLTTPPPRPVVAAPPAPPRVETTTKMPALSTMGRGFKNIFTTPQGASKFMEGLSGGYESPFAQTLSRSAVYAGAMLPFTEKPQDFPSAGSGEGEIVYIPNAYDPSQSTVFQARGQYYKRNAQGQLVPYNPYALAPRGRGFADGGVVDTDPNVAATRSYIEDLNKRARAGLGGLGNAPATTTGGLGTFGPQYLPPPTSGGAGGGGGGAAGGASAGDIIGGLATSYLVNKGIESGIGYLSDKLGLKKSEEPTQPEQQAQQPAPEQPVAQTTPATSAVPYSAALTAISPFTAAAPTTALPVVGEPVYDALGNVSGFKYPDGTVEPAEGYAREPGQLDADLQQRTQVGGDLSRPLSSYATGAAALGGLGSLGAAGPKAGFQIFDELGNIIGGTGTSAAGTASAAGVGGAGTATGVSKGVFGLEKGAPLTGTNVIIPGVQTALGLYEAYKGIESGKESQAALGGLSAGLGAGALAGYSGLAALGPIGLGAAAIAALGASLVNTKEFGDVALRNYWNAVEKEGRGIGSAPPEELAQGFINFYRTNKNQFAGQEKYGRTGNEDFVYDMTQVINDAVKNGKIGKDVDPATMYKEVVQPWLSAMGPGPQDESARKIQDFMMTDLIHNFMQGRPISNAQVKGDKNYKIVSQKPVYAGTSPDLDRTIGGQPVPEDIAKDLYRDLNVRQEDLNSWAMSNPVARMQALGQLPAATSPYTAPVEDTVRAMPMPEQEIISPYTPAAAQGPVQEFVGTPYMPEVPMTPVSPYSAVEAPLFAMPTPDMPEVPMTPVRDPMRIESPEVPVYIPREEAVPITPEAPISYDFNPFEGYNYNPFEGYNMYSYAGGGAIGEGYNFGFAGGGNPGEYRAGGKYLQGPGDGMSDDIKANIDGQQEARLADGEFVIPADVVSHIGNGSSNAGAKKLHQMMARVRQARTGKKKQAPAVKVDRLLPA